MPSASATRKRLADRLDRLAEATGDCRYSAAAGCLRGRKPGRPPCDDAEAVELARRLFRTGLARSRSQAAMRAAIMLGIPSTDVDRLAERWRKKIGVK